MKPRSDSLYARLARENPDLLDEVFADAAKGVDGRAIHAAIKAAGFQCSETAVYQMLHRHGLSWQLRKAAERTEQVERDIPAGKFIATLSRAVRGVILDALLRADDNSERATLARIINDERKLELDERRVELEEDKFEVKTSEILLNLVKAQPQLLAGIVNDTSLTDAERIQRIRERLYGKEATGE